MMVDDYALALRAQCPEAFDVAKIVVQVDEVCIGPLLIGECAEVQLVGNWVEGAGAGDAGVLICGWYRGHASCSRICCPPVSCPSDRFRIFMADEALPTCVRQVPYNVAKDTMPILIQLSRAIVCMLHFVPNFSG